ncbi:MAG: hypothetical protein IPK83_06420 [Planctomycetes bacterium]|nr:hypothetical protein [Planctomycetota bacterium]
MRFSDYRPSRKTVFWTLLGLSAFTLILPPKATDSLKHSTQLLVPLQDVVYFLTFQGARSIHHVNDPDHADNNKLLAMQNELVSQAGLIQQLQSENAELSAIRSKTIPRALQANVVGRDVVEWRNTALLERGSKLGVSPQDWVASRIFINQGNLNDVAEGYAVIAREVLLGRIEQVSPYMSRVCLFTDINSAPLKVRVGGIENGRFIPVEYPCSVHGHGRGEMIIKNVDYRHIERPATNADATADESKPLESDLPIVPDRARGIRIGDLVYSAPGQLGLPVPMAIGKVKEIIEDPSRRLVADVIVVPSLGMDEIRTVSVIPLIPTDVAMDRD